MAKDRENDNQASEKVVMKTDLMKDKINSMMSLVEDDEDEIDETLMKELEKPKKKKFFGLF